MTYPLHPKIESTIGVAFQAPPGSQASSRGEAKNPALLSSRDAVSWSPLSGLKRVQPPLPFGERTRDCSPGHAGKEGPQLACPSPQIQEMLLSFLFCLILIIPVSS